MRRRRILVAEKEEEEIIAKVAGMRRGRTTERSRRDLSPLWNFSPSPGAHLVSAKETRATWQVATVARGTREERVCPSTASRAPGLFFNYREICHISDSEEDPSRLRCVWRFFSWPGVSDDSCNPGNLGLRLVTCSSNPATWRPGAADVYP